MKSNNDYLGELIISSDWIKDRAIGLNDFVMRWMSHLFFEF